MKARLLLALPLLLALGCSSADDDAELPPADPSFKVMSWNLYLGTSFESLFSVASLDEVPDATAAAWAAIQATEFADRAEAIADRIALEEPHLIGLQEVELYRTQSPTDGLTGQPATEVALDFLAVLQQALDARDLDYQVAVSIDNVDVEAPMATDGAADDDIRITDRDVVLARGDVAFENVTQHHFEAMTTYPLPGTPFSIEVPKAWLSLEATFGGRRVLFVNTHLEIEASPPTVLESQGAELVAALAAVELPTVLVGDLNSAPGDGVYEAFIADGFEDGWLLAGNAEAPTCCQAADLQNEASALYERIDHVLVRGGLGVSGVERTGATADERSPGGLWPSDHAGVVATIR